MSLASDIGAFIYHADFNEVLSGCSFASPNTRRVPGAVAILLLSAERVTAKGGRTTLLLESELTGEALGERGEYYRLT